jgi:hypothetical protein
LQIQPLTLNQRSTVFEHHQCKRNLPDMLVSNFSRPHRRSTQQGIWSGCH